MPRKSTIIKTRCSGTKTEAQFIAWVLSALRKMTMKWKPKFDRMNRGRVKKPLGVNGREVWANTCEHCQQWFRTSELDLDHIRAIGGLRTIEGAGQWLVNALVEEDGYQRLCKNCHKIKTLQERKR